MPLRAAGKPWGCPPNPHLPLRAAGGYFCTPKVTKSAGGFDSPGPHKRPLRGVGNALKQKQNPGSRKLLAIWVFLRSISAPGRVGEGGTGGRIETSPGFSPVPRRGIRFLSQRRKEQKGAERSFEGGVRGVPADLFGIVNMLNGIG